MATKKGAAPPIDRPISKSYLREFTGWSTAFPPGLSDPTTLQLMENVLIGRDGAARIRPGLRRLFLDGVWAAWTAGYTNPRIIGGIEPFFLNNGRRAYLFAWGAPGKSTVDFAVLRQVNTRDDAPFEIVSLATAGFARNITPGGTTAHASRPALAINFTSDTKFIRYLQIDNKIMALPDSTNSTDRLRMFRVGATKTAETIWTVDALDPLNSDHAPTVIHPVNDKIPPAAGADDPPISPGAAAIPTANTLISSNDAANDYNIGFFYTFSNDLGETAASSMTVVKVQRPWSAWKWRLPNAQSEPTGAITKNGRRCADQLVISPPAAVLDEARLDFATSWSVYVLMWSDQSNRPVEGTLLTTQAIKFSSGFTNPGGLVRMTPASSLYPELHTLPSTDPVFNINYTEPPRAAQGLIAGDRAVLVNDRGGAAVVRWSSNQAGKYTNFTPAAGGGQKTLSTGNMQILRSAKLWQNPQSVDTITLLCDGVDGYSTSFYMAPAEVTGQTDATPVMGFEETTATPGTTSPFGVEVFNNALYHPLDDQLMKSTANNYNINHKSQTDNIYNKWQALQVKEWIISEQFDKRLYYIVNNPDRPMPDDGSTGNEIWVLDVGTETAVWSRFLISAVSLRRMEFNNRLYLAVIKADGVYILDEYAYYDDTQDSVEAIPWYLRTNTLGANRAHDAWAHVVQMTVLLANTRGTFRYGIKGHDRHGKYADVHKIYRSDAPLPVDTSSVAAASDVESVWNGPLTGPWSWVGAGSAEPIVLSEGGFDPAMLSVRLKVPAPGAPMGAFRLAVPGGPGPYTKQYRIRGRMGFLRFMDGMWLPQSPVPAGLKPVALDYFGSWSPVSSSMAADGTFEVIVQQLAEVEHLDLTLVGDWEHSPVNAYISFAVSSVELIGEAAVVMYDSVAAELLSDTYDPLEIKKDLQEWFFEASSVEDADGNTLVSYGQINSVRFSFTPLSTNIGYEYGSVESFEYGRAGDPWSTRTAINGVPIPMVDPGLIERVSPRE